VVDAPETGRDGLPARSFATQPEWERWLLEHGAAERGLWLKFAKKGSGHRSITAAQAVEGALCHGWIDGQIGRWDDGWYVVRFSPRKPRSVWSKINVATVERLLAEGRMAPTGLAAVERGRASGSWDRAYDPASTASVPEDLQEALDADPRAAAAFAALSRTRRYSLLWSVQTATPRNRPRVVARAVADLARGDDAASGPGP
jgi:uncharacterized protein YdeI (YjbR/CyaY-like superfamily)